MQFLQVFEIFTWLQIITLNLRDLNQILCLMQVLCLICFKLFNV